MAPRRGAQCFSFAHADRDQNAVLLTLMVPLYPLKAATQRALPVAQVNQFNISRDTIVLDNAHCIGYEASATSCIARKKPNFSKIGRVVD
jgi:hypothetical protein